MTRKLLIVEDTPLHLAILAKIGAQEGFTATSARCFAEAARLLAETDFDCVTLDLSLGEQSGTEVLRFLSHINCRTPIIVISGSEQSVREQTVRLGNELRLNLCEPVPKPIDIAALRVLLRRLADVPLGRVAVSAAGEHK